MILVTGATGFLGRCVVEKLKRRNAKFTETSLSLGTDLRDEKEVLLLFEKIKPTHVINCAAYVGGIQFGYKHTAEIFKNNLLMTINLLEACHKYGVKRLVNPISNCAYPAEATLYKEEEFWDGALHESVLSYGFARKASWVGAWSYAKQYGSDTINVILSNMYGPNDHFDEERSHALGALVMKIVEAKRNNYPEVTVWGTGKPVREWLYIEDGAEALIRALDIEKFDGIINIGVAKGISIHDLAVTIKENVGYEGELVFDESKPDGAAYKTVDGSLGEKLLKWSPKVDLEEGIKNTIDWYLKNR